MLHRALLAAALALLISFAGMTQVRAEWHKPPPRCTEGYYRSHRNGTCGWHTVPALIRHVFRRSESYALCVGYRESRYYAKATNGQYKGVFQFGYGWYAGHFNPYNPVANVLRAWTGSRYGTNWTPWSWECGR